MSSFYSLNFEMYLFLFCYSNICNMLQTPPGLPSANLLLFDNAGIVLKNRIYLHDSQGVWVKPDLTQLPVIILCDDSLV